jgi:hypothetical protein
MIITSFGSRSGYLILMKSLIIKRRVLVRYITIGYIYIGLAVIIIAKKTGIASHILQTVKQRWALSSDLGGR